jgi:hypothetical protein
MPHRRTRVRREVLLRAQDSAGAQRRLRGPLLEWAVCSAAATLEKGFCIGDAETPARSLTTAQHIEGSEVILFSMTTKHVPGSIV